MKSLKPLRLRHGLLEPQNGSKSKARLTLPRCILPSASGRFAFSQPSKNQTMMTYQHYRDDPVGYARDVLGVEWWDKQREIAEALLRPPHRVLVKACHKVGKTHLAGGLVNWWYDCYDPGLVLTTAPTARQVKDLLWKEVRVQRRGRPGLHPRAPRMESSPSHFAHGFTARDGESFQGHHSPHTLFVFDEAVGVDPIFWEATESMFNDGCAWLAIFNPTTTSSQAYIEEQSVNWHVITISVLDHVNVHAELQGFPPPYPSAIRLGRLETLLQRWCRPVDGAPRITDIEWPPGSGQWLRPGPIAESRLLGRWPSMASNTVWSDAAFTYVSTHDLPEGDDPITIGCDVARFGDDFTAIHVRRGNVSLHHERANGWRTSEVAGRLKQLCQQWGRHAGQEPERVTVYVDDDGVGGGVIDQAGGYTFQGISGARRAIDRTGYPNRRSELWFTTAERANEGNLSLARLDSETLTELRRQALAPTWSLDSQGRRVVEPKDVTRRRLNRSPDDMDAVNLAYTVSMERLVFF